MLNALPMLHTIFLFNKKYTLLLSSRIGWIIVIKINMIIILVC